MDTVLANIHNYAQGRQGHKITRICFHRDAVQGATATGEATYFSTHVLDASAGCFIDFWGNICISVPFQDHSFSTDEWNEDNICYSIEFGGLNGSALSQPQITTAVKLIKSSPLLASVPLHRLSLPEIPPRIIPGYECHRDITLSYKEPGMSHVDFITDLEIQSIFSGLR